MDLGELNVSLFDPWYNLMIHHSLPLISQLGSPLFHFAVHLRPLYQDTLLWFFILQKCCMLWVDLMGLVSQHFLEFVGFRDTQKIGNPPPPQKKKKKKQYES